MLDDDHSLVRTPLAAEPAPPTTSQRMASGGSPHHDHSGGERPRHRRRIGFFLGPALLVAIVAAPLPLTHEQHMLVAVLAFAMTYWISEAIPIPVTSLLVLALSVFLAIAPTGGSDGTTPADFVFGEFSSPTLFLLIGGMLIARSMMKHGLSRRMALAVLSLPGVSRSTHRVIVAFGALGALLSSVTDNGAVVAMLLPIALGLDKAVTRLTHIQLPETRDKRRLAFSTALMLMMTYATTVGALLTPVGDASNLLGRSFIESRLGLRVSFIKWFLLAAPIVVVLFIVLCIVVIGLNKPELNHMPGMRAWVQSERHGLGPMSRGELITAVVFGVAIVAWLLPSVIGLLAGDDSSLRLLVRERLDASVVAILAAAALFLLPVDWPRRRFVLTWADAKEIEWGLLLLVGSALVLASLMETTGLAAIIGDLLADAVGDTSPLLVYLLAAGAAIMMSEMTSNLASVSIVVPIIPALTHSVGGDPVTATLIATFASTYGFMFPISTSANALAYSSGLIPITKMMRTGVIVDLSGIVIITLGITAMRSIVPV